MKNVIHPMPPTEQLRANTAIKKIQKWIEERYPKLTAVSKTKLIIECLIELTEEKSFLAANN